MKGIINLNVVTPPISKPMLVDRIYEG